MQYTTMSLILGLLGTTASACNCQNNNDAGRWIDSNSPGAKAATLIDNGGGCYDATVQGHMCVTLTAANDALKDCLSDKAINDQSYHGDWFLWTSITCEDGDARAVLNIT